MSQFIRELRRKNKEKERIDRISLKKLNYYKKFKEQFSILEVTLKLSDNYDKYTIEIDKNTVTISRNISKRQYAQSLQLHGIRTMKSFFTLEGLMTFTGFKIDRISKDKVVINTFNFPISKETKKIINSQHCSIKLNTYFIGSYTICIDKVMSLIDNGNFLKIITMLLKDLEDSEEFKVV